MVDDLVLSVEDAAELAAILDDPVDDDLDIDGVDGDTVVAALGRRKRRKCKRTPAHPHCKSVKWSRVYEALRRKGKSKKNAAQIANSMHNKWLMGRVKRKTWP